MKITICGLVILLTAGLTSSWAQDTWTQKADFGGVAREGATGFSIGSKGYIGLGAEYPTSYKDFWEYDPDANTWTQKADFGGHGRLYAVGFTIADKGYVGTGQSGSFPNYIYYKDFWEYDPNSNTWTRKANFGGTARYGAAGFSIDGKGYLGTGVDASTICKKDFWEFDPIQNIWTQKADFGGTERKWAIGLTIGAKGYVGTGTDNLVTYRDFWEFDPDVNTWSQKADFGGIARVVPAGFSIGNKGYIGTGENESGSLKDFWEFDPTSNTWLQKSDFGGGEVNQATGFTIGTRGYIGTGVNLSSYRSDFWEYAPRGTSTSCLPPPAGLVSWWSGDRTADDVQGTNNGRLLNGTSFTKGMVGPGFSFNGIDQWVKIPNSNSLNLTRLTLDAWLYMTGNENMPRHVVGKDDGAIIREYSLGVNNNNYVEGFVVVPSGLKVVTGVTTAELNTWYHIAMTYDGTKLRLYVNGVQDAVADAVGDIVPTLDAVAIGGDPFGEFTKGIVDEAQIFNRALTDAEILGIYQAGAAGQCKPEIFVSSIDPSYTVVNSQYLVTTSVAIEDTNGIGISDATVKVKTFFPNGSELVFPAQTDDNGTASFSFYTLDTGLYTFKVIRVSQPVRDYNPALNVETTDTLVIP